MPNNFARDLKKILEKNGCYYLRAGKGDHEIWFSPITKQKVTVDNGCPSRHTANAVLKQAGLTKMF